MAAENASSTGCSSALGESKPFIIDEIADLADRSRRTVPHYIQSRLFDCPQGVGKGAYYTQRYVEQLLLVSTPE